MTNIPSQYVADVKNAARKLGIPMSIVAAQINYESGFDPHAVSPTGAEGIAQFEPATWASYGKGSPFNPADAFAAYTNFMGVLLREFHGNVDDALAAYNAGPGDLAAGRGYAAHVLAEAGQGTSITSSGNSSGNDGGSSNSTIGQPHYSAAENAAFTQYYGGSSTEQTGIGKYIPGILAGIGASGAPGSGLAGAGGAGGMLNLLTFPGDMVNFFKDMLKLFEPSFWFRVGSGVVGIVLLIIALFMFTGIGKEMTKAGTTTAKTAAKAALL